MKRITYIAIILLSIIGAVLTGAGLALITTEPAEGATPLTLYIPVREVPEWEANDPRSAECECHNKTR